MNTRFIRFLVLASLLVMMGLLVLPAGAQVERCSEGRPRAQVRFYDFSDIPVYQTATAASDASDILSGAVVADQIPTPAFRISGGQRQKYLLCGDFSVGDGAVRIVVIGGTVWAPEYLVESIVPRLWRDNQAGSPGDW